MVEDANGSTTRPDASGTSAVPPGEMTWALLNASNEMAALMDTDARILALNESMARQLGRSVGEIVGTYVWDNMPAEIAEERIRMGQQVVDTGVPTRFQDERNGRFFLNSMAPVFDAEGRVIQVAAFVRDITDLVQAEQEQRLAALGRLSTGVAHEFNNLMGALLLAARMVEVPEANEDLRDLVDLIIRSTTCGREIARDLLTFARRQDARLQEVRLEEPVEAAIRLAQPSLQKSQLRLVQDFRTDGWVVHANATQIELVILNLLLNACQATPEGGLLEVRVRHEPEAGGNGSVIVEVADTGCGIAAQDLPHLFEPFFKTKGPLGMSEVPGTGLGLSVCHGILEHHAGAITVQSTPGAGSVFTVRLPAVAPEPQAPAEPAGRDEPMARPRLRGRVLVAEDQPDMLKLLQRLLVVEGCEATVTPLTEEALAALREQRFDLVISDYQMPGGGAPRILEATRNLADPPPVIIITGSTDPAAAEQLVQKGAAACLFKPFELSDLRQVMAELLSP